jgi:ketosteroid isomerase-like protein
MGEVEREIEAMVNLETRAWDTKDVEVLLSIFHPDMVWPWPINSQSHDPEGWVLELGRFNRERWRRGWQDLFDNYRLVHNHRVTRKIVVSKEGDGAFAVVDVDTLWVDCKGQENRWKGRACKVYTKVAGAWKLIMQTGLLDYSGL